MTAQEPLRRLTAAVLGLAIAACGGGEADPSESGGTEASPQEAAQTAAGLTSAGELPRPCLVGQSIWPGTAVQLMVADAWASCLRSICQSDSTCSNPEAAFNSPNGTLSLNSPTTPHLVGHDLYLGRVGEFMGGVDWLFTNESWSWPLAAREMTFARWAKHRANAALNCRPSEGADGVSVDIGLPDAALPDTLSLSGLNDAGSYSAISPTGRLAAAAELQRPALNLCIAQQLRRSAPGALGAEALLLSEAEQRELLSVIRERAQLAALGAAQIASVTTGEPNPFLGGLELDQIGWGTGFLETSDSRLAIIQRWAMETRIAAGGDAAKTMRAVLTSIGADLGAAVQLHLAATEELANLFARSGSARSPSSSQERENQADDTWGYESWQQRTYALLYGGDPLAVGGFAPWIHPVVTTPPGAASTTDPTVGGDDSWLYGFFPGIVNAADASIVTPVGRAAVALGDERSHFPASRDSGYALEPLRAHESHLALGLLQQHDLLDLVLTGSGDCRTIDPEDTAERWATTLDAALYARAC
ncbi:MAG: hypothetical protein FJ104_11430, partial [Deltaproteobacteria bacterium]|nr:hypothetical protein [Deltaproteobacteria bacterium]